MSKNSKDEKTFCINDCCYVEKNLLEQMSSKTLDYLEPIECPKEGKSSIGVLLGIQVLIFF